MTADPERWLTTEDELLAITSRRQGTTLILDVRGEWDLAGAGSVGAAIATALEDRPECLVLDLTELTFIDSTGLHAVDDLSRHAESRGVRLIVLVRASGVQRAFDVSGLSRQLPLVVGGRGADAAPACGHPRAHRAERRSAHRRLRPR